MADAGAKPPLAVVIDAQRRAEDLGHLPALPSSIDDAGGKIDIADSKAVGPREFPDARGGPPMGALRCAASACRVIGCDSRARSPALPGWNLSGERRFT